MSLFNLVRPKNFNQIIGQENSVAVLKAKLNSQTVPHTIIFTGPSGVGKSTMAKLLAQELKAGELSEINCADFRGIDTIREIREDNRYRPISGGVRVWILEEVIQLPKATQQAFLDGMEHPPSYVYYLMTASDTASLLPTFLSRCFQVSLSTLSRAHIKYIVTDALDRSGAGVIGKDVIGAIADNCGGNARVALQLLELALASPEESRVEVVGCAALDVKEKAEFLAIVLLRRPDWKEVYNTVIALDSNTIETVRRQVCDYCMKCMADSYKAGLCYKIISLLDQPLSKAGLMASCYEYWSETCQKRRGS